MSIVNLSDLLKPAALQGYAVAAFNIVNYQTTQAVILAAEKINSPLILQTSVSTVKAIGAKPLITFVRDLAESARVPVAIHLDHCTDYDLVLKCADLGWSSVMIDLSSQPYEENKDKTAQVVTYCHARGVSVEGELGAIMGVEDDLFVSQHDAALADPDLSVDYCQATGIDAFAPAIGTAHGLYKGVPKVEFELLRTIANRVSCPVVVHGGTGLSDDAFRQCIRQGAAKINISTALKIAYCQGLSSYLQKKPEENNPLKVDAAAMEDVMAMATRHMILFGSEGKA